MAPTFQIVYAHVSKLNIENPIGTHGLQGHRPSGPTWWLASEDIWRCAGRGWIKAPAG